jgi:uncharacterized protein (TIGR03790 family)
MNQPARKILKMTLILLIATFTTLTYALPSYDDVLLVINDDSPQSIEIGTYFQQQRQIPPINVCHIRTKDAQLFSDTSNMTEEAEANAINAIKNYLVNNNLEDKINYIALTRGIPYWSQHVESSGTRHLFDKQLLTSLANLKYGSGSIFKFNPFYYYIQENFENLVDYKFTKARYGYYIVARLDGPGISGAKQQIDNSGYPAYHAYNKDNIKYLVMPPKFRTGTTSKKTEIDKRTNIKITYPDMYDNNDNSVPLPGGSGLLQRDVAKQISFAYFDWVGWETDFTTWYSNGEASAYYPSPYRGIEFLPGGICEAFRSNPAVSLTRNTGGVLELNPATNTSRTFRQFLTGDDLRFRHLTCAAYDPVNDWLWCGTGDTPFDEGQSYGDGRVSDAAKQGYAKHRGGGMAVFNATTGATVSHFSPDSTAFYTPDASDLSNARVVDVAYDKYNKFMWIAHYNGIQYYDLQNNTWHAIPELTNDFAGACTIYIDPFDTDKVYFAFYYDMLSYKAVVSSQISGAQHSIFEYSKSAKTVTSYEIDPNVNGNLPSIAKTSADIVWVTMGTKIIKYRLSTRTQLQSIDINDVVQFETIPDNFFSHRGLVSMINSRDEKIVCVAFASNPGTDEKPMKAYILSLRETGETTAAQTLVHNQEWEFGLNKEQPPQALITDPLSPNTIYLALGGRRGGSAWKSTDGRGTQWATCQQGAAVEKVLGMAAGENGKVYLLRASYLGQQIVGDFMMDGAVAVGGGMVHDSMYYNENDHSGFVRPPMSPTGPYIGDSGEGHTAQTQVEAMMFMILDGYSIADARFGVFNYYPKNGGGGHISHMVAMPPKCAPFAPRVDETNTEFEVDNDTTITIKLHSPGLIASMDGFFASTINSDTVKVFDADMQPVTPASISYDTDDREIIITGTFPGPAYFVTLKCGNDGIKNIKGAPMINTRKDEFKDEITYAFGDAIAPTVPTGLTSTVNNDFSVYLNWHDSIDTGSGISNYEVQVDNNADFSSPEFSDNPSESHVTTDDDLSDGPYFWRVRARDVAGNYSAWSQVSSFMLDKAGNSFATANTIPLDEEGRASTNGWVGAGDLSDYYKFIPANSGKFDFSITELSSKVKCSIYMYDAVKNKYKRVASLKVDKNSGLMAVKDILLHGNVTHYAVIESSDRGTGEYNTAYRLNIIGDYYPAATDNNSFDKATAVAFSDDKIEEEGWVGFGDAADYYKFSPAYNGMFDIRLKDMTTKVKFAIYMYDAVKNKYKRVLSLKIDKNSGRMEVSNFKLYSATTYYAVIEAADGGKGKANTVYSMELERNGYF